MKKLLFSEEFGYYKVEVGAQWIHGFEGNVAYDLAKENGLVMDPHVESIYNKSVHFFQPFSLISPSPYRVCHFEWQVNRF